MGFRIDDMWAATALTRQGRLTEATQAIQAALARAGLAAAEPAQRESRRPPEAPDAAPYAARHAAALAEVSDIAFRDLPPGDLPEGGLAEEPPAAQPPAQPRFIAGRFPFGSESYRYRLFVPARVDPQAALPVLVLLHGCKQDADDFAAGTGMNAVAQREQFLVLYPSSCAAAKAWAAGTGSNRRTRRAAPASRRCLRPWSKRSSPTMAVTARASM